MTVGIVGLGLIGGSFAKAYHAAGHTVLAFDIDRSTYDFAVLSGTVNGPLTDETLSTCDLILIAVIPSAAVDYLKHHAAHIGPKPVVIDCCGTKRVVCAACFPLAKEHGFTYLGGHPMAGTHNSGFKYATPTMFHNAPMVLVPENHNDIQLLSRAARRDDRLYLPAGPCGVQRLHQEPHSGAAQGLLRRQLQGYDPGSLAGPPYVGGAVSGKQGVSDDGA